MWGWVCPCAPRRVRDCHCWGIFPGHAACRCACVRRAAVPVPSPSPVPAPGQTSRDVNSPKAEDHMIPKQTLEINPAHPVIRDLSTLRTTNPDFAVVIAEQVRCGAVRCGAVRCGAVRCGAV